MSKSYILQVFRIFFFFNDTATTEIYTLSLHDALPIGGSYYGRGTPFPVSRGRSPCVVRGSSPRSEEHTSELSHSSISYAVFCLKKKKDLSFVKRLYNKVDGHRDQNDPFKKS